MVIATPTPRKSSAVAAPNRIELVHLRLVLQRIAQLAGGPEASRDRHSGTRRDLWITR